MNDETAKRSAKVLLVEDDHADQEILKRIVSQGALRAALHIESSGQSALDYLEKSGDEIDLILLDLNMPGLNGLETLAEIRKRAGIKTIPVIMLTTSDSEQDVIKSYELGANSFVTKPIQFDEFIRVVREIDEYWFDLTVLPSGRRA